MGRKMLEESGVEDIPESTEPDDDLPSPGDVTSGEAESDGEDEFTSSQAKKLRGLFYKELHKITSARDEDRAVLNQIQGALTQLASQPKADNGGGSPDSLLEKWRPQIQRDYISGTFGMLQEMLEARDQKIEEKLSASESHRNSENLTDLLRSRYPELDAQSTRYNPEFFNLVNQKYLQEASHHRSVAEGSPLQYALIRNAAAEVLIDRPEFRKKTPARSNGDSTVPQGSPPSPRKADELPDMSDSASTGKRLFELAGMSKRLNLSDPEVLKKVQMFAKDIQSRRTDSR